MDAHDYKSVFYSVKCLIHFVINNQYSNKQTYMHTQLNVSMEQSEMRLGQIKCSNLKVVGLNPSNFKSVFFRRFKSFDRLMDEIKTKLELWTRFLGISLHLPLPFSRPSWLRSKVYSPR